jgi:hypothetical protein
VTVDVLTLPAVEREVGAVRLRVRLRGRLRFRQWDRLRFPALCAPSAGFPRTHTGFWDGRTGDISMSAGKSPDSRPLTGENPWLRRVVHGLPLWLLADLRAVRSWLGRLVTWPWVVSCADRVAASRRRCFAALARLVEPAALRVLFAKAAGRTAQPSLSRRLPGRSCERPRWRLGGAR